MAATERQEAAQAEQAEGGRLGDRVAGAAAAAAAGRPAVGREEVWHRGVGAGAPRPARALDAGKAGGPGVLRNVDRAQDDRVVAVGVETEDGVAEVDAAAAIVDRLDVQ